MKILITGATSGIGEGLARALQGKGTLLLTGRNKEKLSALKQELQAEVLECDLASSSEPVLRWIEQHKPTLIFNNAGFGLYGPFEKLSEKEIRQMVQVNCLSLSEITHKAIGLWRKEGAEGTVVNISSMASFVPFPTGALYGATKAFVTHLSFSLDLENKKDGIRILATCPGMVDTEFSKRASRGKNGVARSKTEKYVMMDTDKVVEEILHQLEKKIPVRVVDGRYRCLHFLYKFVPDSLVGALITWNLKKRL